MAVVGFIGGIGPWEMGIVLVIVLILFGAGKLPQVFRSFGEGMKAFRDGQKDGPEDEAEPSPPAELGDAGEPVSEAEEVKEKVG